MNRPPCRGSFRRDVYAGGWDRATELGDAGGNVIASTLGSQL